MTCRILPWTVAVQDPNRIEFHYALAARYKISRHEPNHPEVAASYAAFRASVLEQYTRLRSMLDIKHTIEDPYANASLMFYDIDRNKRLRVYRGHSLPEGHPMAALIQHHDGENALILNDAFRAIHDYYGHYAGPDEKWYPFHEGGEVAAELPQRSPVWLSHGPLWDEELAFRRHRKMFPPEAWMALVSETRAQTACNNLANPGEYVEQRCAWLPNRFTHDGRTE